MIITNEVLIVVDVREEGEYCNNQHIPGALLYPWSSGILQDRYSELPSNDDILVVCHSGSRSVPASDFLCTHGFTSIYNMTGGMVDWQWETVGCVDSDSDGVNDDLDNCPGDNNPNQEDTYPPQKNGCGDACECEADIEPPNGDGDVDGSDAFVFKQKFFKPECATTPPYCPGDFDCDKDVDGSDAFMFKQDFFKPNCPTNCNPRGSAEWCEYQ